MKELAIDLGLEPRGKDQRDTLTIVSRRFTSIYGDPILTGGNVLWRISNIQNHYLLLF